MTEVERWRAAFPDMLCDDDCHAGEGAFHTADCHRRVRRAAEYVERRIERDRTSRGRTHSQR